MHFSSLASALLVATTSSFAHSLTEESSVKIGVGVHRSSAHTDKFTIDVIERDDFALDGTVIAERLTAVELEFEVGTDMAIRVNDVSVPAGMADVNVKAVALFASPNQDLEEPLRRVSDLKIQIGVSVKEVEVDKVWINQVTILERILEVDGVHGRVEPKVFGQIFNVFPDGHVEAGRMEADADEAMASLGGKHSKHHHHHCSRLLHALHDASAWIRAQTLSGQMFIGALCGLVFSLCAIVFIAIGKKVTARRRYAAVPELPSYEGATKSVATEVSQFDVKA